jgi:hypothetical protein
LLCVFRVVVFWSYLSGETLVDELVEHTRQVDPQTATILAKIGGCTSAIHAIRPPHRTGGEGRGEEEERKEEKERIEDRKEKKQTPPCGSCRAATWGRLM